MKRPAPLSSSAAQQRAAGRAPAGAERTPTSKAKGSSAGGQKPKPKPRASAPSAPKTSSGSPSAARSKPTGASGGKPKATRPTAQTRPARSRRPPEPVSTRRVDVRGWLGGLRLSGFTVIMLGLVILAVCVLVPTVSTYVGQQQQITALKHSVKVTEDEVAALNLERQRWKDPAYIAAQARERLYYVKPGDVVYLVIDDLPASRTPREQGAVSKHVEQTKTDWASQLVASVAQAGTAQVAVSK